MFILWWRWTDGTTASPGQPGTWDIWRISCPLTQILKLQGSDFCFPHFKSLILFKTQLLRKRSLRGAQGGHTSFLRQIFGEKQENRKKYWKNEASSCQPHSKNGQNSLLSIYIDWSSHPFFRALWSLNLTHQAKDTKLPLLYLLPMCGTNFAFIASHENAEDHQMSA